MGKCLIKVRIHCSIYLNLAFFFTNYAIFLKLCNRMWFEINYCAKSHQHIISDGLQNQKRHSPGCSSMSLSKQHFAGLLKNFLPLCNAIERKTSMSIKWLFFHRSCNLNRSILALVCPMPHLLALFSIVKI